MLRASIFHIIVLNVFLEEEEQKEVVGLFNARIKEVETQEELEKALKETIIRVKQNSMKYHAKNRSSTDMSGLMKLVEDKKHLEELEKLHISIF